MCGPMRTGPGRRSISRVLRVAYKRYKRQWPICHSVFEIVALASNVYRYLSVRVSGNGIPSLANVKVALHTALVFPRQQKLENLQPRTSMVYATKRHGTASRLSEQNVRRDVLRQYLNASLHRMPTLPSLMVPILSPSAVRYLPIPARWVAVGCTTHHDAGEAVEWQEGPSSPDTTTTMATSDATPVRSSSNVLAETAFYLPASTLADVG